MDPGTAKLSFCAAATGPDLRLVVHLDDVIIYDAFPDHNPVAVDYDFDDSKEGDHVLTFEMRGKRSEHTKLDAAGNIKEDRCIVISDLSFDDIQLGHIVASVARYYHNNNDSTEPVVDKFYGIMGCNGRVEMPFSTPAYLWLLENM
jgi:hypothetical protein